MSCLSNKKLSLISIISLICIGTVLTAKDDKNIDSLNATMRQIVIVMNAIMSEPGKGLNTNHETLRLALISQIDTNSFIEQEQFFPGVGRQFRDKKIVYFLVLVAIERLGEKGDIYYSFFGKSDNMVEAIRKINTPENIFHKINLVNNNSVVNSITTEPTEDNHWLSRDAYKIHLSLPTNSKRWEISSLQSGIIAMATVRLEQDDWVSIIPFGIGWGGDMDCGGMSPTEFGNKLYDFAMSDFLTKFESVE
jgi:hypothetical protein